MELVCRGRRAGECAEREQIERAEPADELAVGEPEAGLGDDPGAAADAGGCDLGGELERNVGSERRGWDGVGGVECVKVGEVGEVAAAGAGGEFLVVEGGCVELGEVAAAGAGGEWLVVVRGDGEMAGG